MFDQRKHAVQDRQPHAQESTSSQVGQVEGVAYSSLKGQTQKVRLRINTPVSDRIHVRCGHCKLRLEVPPNLGRSETGVQKLRCSSCWKISRFRLNHLLEPSGKESMVAISFEPSHTSLSPTSQDVGSSNRQQKSTTISPDRNLKLVQSEEEKSTVHLKLGPTGLSNPTRATPTTPEFDEGHKLKGLKGFLKKSVKALTKGKESTQYRRNVVVNSQAVPDEVVRRAEDYAGGIHPGSYWYDYRAGFWGVMGGPCLGMIPPFIQELNFPLARHCSHGKTGVLVNGRELHHKDLELLKMRGLPETPGKAYNVDIDGCLTEETTGMELKGLGRLAPTLEWLGMWVPDNQRGS